MYPETRLVNKPNEKLATFNYFGALPKPEDFIIKHNKQNLDDILMTDEWENSRSELIDAHLIKVGLRTPYK